MSTYQRPVTPASLSTPLQELVRQIVPNETPIYVDVQAITHAPNDECFVLVPEQIKRNGGEAAIGWALWEWPSLFVEAEFHSVWRAPNGSLLDVTPKKSPTQKILFLPDPSRPYEGRQVNNVRMPVSRSPAVLEFLRVSDAEYEFMNRGERAVQHGYIKVQGAEAQEYAEIQRIKTQCFLEMLRLKPSVNAYDPCPCGSGQKVKWCHGVAHYAV